MRLRSPPDGNLPTVLPDEALLPVAAPVDAELERSVAASVSLTFARFVKGATPIRLVMFRSGVWYVSGVSGMTVLACQV